MNPDELNTYSDFVRVRTELGNVLMQSELDDLHLSSRVFKRTRLLTELHKLRQQLGLNMYGPGLERLDE